MNIYVGNLSWQMTDEDLRTLFEQYGSVTSAKIVKDKTSGRSKGFGFVEMPDSVEGKDAIESMNDISLGKKPLVVKEAEENRNAPRPGGYGSGNSGNGGFRRPNDRNR